MLSAASNTFSVMEHQTPTHGPKRIVQGNVNLPLMLQLPRHILSFCFYYVGLNITPSLTHLLPRKKTPTKNLELHSSGMQTISAAGS